MGDVNSQEQVAAPLTGHADGVNCMAVSDNEARVVPGSDDNTVRTWDVRNGQEVGSPLTSQSSWVGSVAVSGDRQRCWFTKWGDGDREDCSQLQNDTNGITDQTKRDQIKPFPGAQVPHHASSGTAVAENGASLHKVVVVSASHRRLVAPVNPPSTRIAMSPHSKSTQQRDAPT